MKISLFGRYSVRVLVIIIETFTKTETSSTRLSFSAPFFLDKISIEIGGHGPLLRSHRPVVLLYTV